MMMTTNKSISLPMTPVAGSTLSDLTKESTAFFGWSDFKRAMDNGYCPTLRPDGGRSKAGRLYNAHVIELREVLVGMGYSVFPKTL